MTLSAPEALGDRHDTGAFNSGVAALDDWLRRRAKANQASRASRTFVVCDRGVVVGYYALASGAVRLAQAPGALRRNMPDPVPMVILGRLAVDATRQRTGLGSALLRDAALRVLRASETIGVRGLALHAISDEARTFYLERGFLPSPLDPMTLMVSVASLRILAD